MMKNQGLINLNLNYGSILLIFRAGQSVSATCIRTLPAKEGIHDYFS
jgi:hypothetical protein